MEIVPSLTSSEMHTELAALRKQLRILTIAVIALFSTSGFFFFRQLERPSKVKGWPTIFANEFQAKRITLLSDDGHEAAVLGTKDGRPVLQLFDKEGDTRLILSVRDDGGHIVLTKDKDNSVTSLSEGALMMGNDKDGSIILQSAPHPRTHILVSDGAGFSVQLGQVVLLNPTDGTFSVTSAASLVGSSKNSTSQWPLIRPPAQTTATH
jgi:hypothetical protein